MNQETLNQAKLLERQIKLLKDEKKKYEHNGICHLRLQDHYGNGGQILMLYALPFELVQAMGNELESRLSLDFRIYLESIQRMIQNRIDYLQNKLNEL